MNLILLTLYDSSGNFENTPDDICLKYEYL